MNVRTTIVGCGAVAQRLYLNPIRHLSTRGLLNVVAVVDPVTEHTRAMCRVLSTARPFGSLEDALSHSPSDLTVILSPAHLHARHTLLALDSGSHVLCEK